MIDVSTIQHPRGRQPTYSDLVKLAEALDRYGYYRSTHRSSDCLCIVDCQIKPYDSWYDHDSIVIVHPYCTLNGHEHQQAFLQAMIPIIGKLDALAYYEPGEEHKLGPRLRIYL